jgi:molybdate transport system substrate-binding protein
MSRGTSIVVTVVLFVGLVGCSGDSDGQPTDGRDITVFAASSLTNVFTEFGQAYESATGDAVTFSFAGSQDLVNQVQQGAPADVIATADTDTMDRVAGELADDYTVFARNTLVIVVPPGNPKHVRGLADLADLDVILADPSVPAGRYAAQALDDAGVSVKPKSLELEVRSVLTKVELGEADAGIVYATDAASAGSQVAAVTIANSPSANYAVAAVNADGKLFAELVTSAQGAQILQHYGFIPP